MERELIDMKDIFKILPTTQEEKITLFYDWVVRGSLYSEAPDDALSIVLGLDYLEEELMWL